MLFNLDAEASNFEAVTHARWRALVSLGCPMHGSQRARTGPFWRALPVPDADEAR